MDILRATKTVVNADGNHTVELYENELMQEAKEVMLGIGWILFVRHSGENTYWRFSKDAPVSVVEDWCYGSSEVK